MDLETSASIERVGERIDRLEHRIDVLEVTMRAEFSAVRTEFRAEFSAVRVEMGQLRDGLRVEFRDGLAEVRRHAEILHETLRHDIRMLAEGFATITVKLDAMQR